MRLTFLEAALAMPGFTAVVAGTCGLIIVLLLWVYWTEMSRYCAYRNALKEPKADVKFWIEAKSYEVTDEAGNHMYIREALELYMSCPASPRVFLVDDSGRIRAYLTEIVANGFVVQGAQLICGPSSNAPD